MKISTENKIFAVLLLIFSALHMAGAEVAALLDKFNESPTAATANAFFSQLNAEQFTDVPMHFSSATAVDTLRQQVWYWAAEYFYDGQDYKQAEAYGLKALPLCKVGGNRVVEGDCENLLAVIYIRLAEYDKAAAHAQACHALDQRSGDPDAMSSSLNTLAAIYMAARQPQEAEKYVLRGLELSKKANNPVRQAVLNGMASEVYHTLGDEQKALDYARVAYDLEVKLGRADKAAMRQAQMGAALLWLKRTDEAKQMLMKAIPVLREAGNIQSLGIACNQMGGVMLAEKNLDKAAQYYREAIDIFVKLKDYYNESHARLGLYNAVKDSDPTLAMQQMERYKALKDSIYDSETAESLGRHSAEYANEELLLENASQRTTTRNAIIIGVMVALLLCLMAVVIWWIMRKRNRVQGAINEQLSANIDELREQYKQLHIHYDNALKTIGAGAGTTDEQELSDADRTFIESAVNIINEQINAGKIDVATVAERLNMSQYQLRQRIVSITGENPQAFMQVIRMRRARYLLDNNPQLNITEVAQLCAYNDTPNFTRAFKNAFGITPSQYVERSRE